MGAKKKRQTERERISIIMAHFPNGCKHQVPGASSEFPMCVAEAQVRGPSSAASQAIEGSWIKKWTVWDSNQHQYAMQAVQEKILT